MNADDRGAPWLSPDKPAWLLLFDQLTIPVLDSANVALRPDNDRGPHELAMCQIALKHLAGCLHYSSEANRRGGHTVALGLIRQVVEALTVVEAGLLAAAGDESPLKDWADDGASMGAMRRHLEAHVWPRYGGGLWYETWAEFFRNLAAAVQPYAHCTHQLMQWGLSIQSGPARSKDGGMLMLAIPGAYDPEKASRLTLLQAACVWALGRLVSEHGDHERDESLALMRGSIAESRLLDPGSDWGRQLIPHQWFYE